METSPFVDFLAAEESPAGSARRVRVEFSRRRTRDYGARVLGHGRSAVVLDGDTFVSPHPHIFL